MLTAHSPDVHPIPTELDPIAPSELREFFSGDDPPVDADPAFRERLRGELWTLVVDRYAERSLTD